MISDGIYVMAALAEIAGCFAFWAWLRLGKSAGWLLPGMVSLMIFAWLLTRIDSASAGRAYAANGGVYIAASPVWLWQGVCPDRGDLFGASTCFLDAFVILFAPRTA